MTSLALKNIASDSSYTFQSYPSICIVGKRCTGKTEIAKHFIKKHFSSCPLLVVTPLKHQYKELTNSIIDIDTFDNEKDNIINTKSEFTLVIDDYSFKDLANTNIIDLFKLNRHLKINIILICQTIQGMVPDMKVNLDYILFTGETNFSCIRSLYSNFPVCPTFDSFNKIVKAVFEQPYQFLFIDINKNYSLYYHDKINIEHTKYQLDFNYKKNNSTINIDKNNNKELKDYIKNIEANLIMIKKLINIDEQDEI